jgi:hypothetical protein
MGLRRRHILIDTGRDMKGTMRRPHRCGLCCSRQAGEVLGWRRGSGSSPRSSRLLDPNFGLLGTVTRRASALLLSGLLSLLRWRCLRRLLHLTPRSASLLVRIDVPAPDLRWSARRQRSGRARLLVVVRDSLELLLARPGAMRRNRCRLQLTVFAGPGV